MKEFRARLDLTQQQLASLVNLRRETIVHLENGKYNSSLKLAMDIAKVLNTTVNELFTFIED
ncbi:helix-turn-helix transcriptional regulator [Natroniella sp. ANB-PHB2]|uniref:helix-turn-helix transcriptional regulator n=1 Tax=Natroniella sp. ANB-PHB2 TaxID=3384444 RepID=UPI0038D4DC06